MTVRCSLPRPRRRWSATRPMRPSASATSWPAGCPAPTLPRPLLSPAWARRSHASTTVWVWVCGPTDPSPMLWWRGPATRPTAMKSRSGSGGAKTGPPASWKRPGCVSTLTFPVPHRRPPPAGQAPCWRKSRASFRSSTTTKPRPFRRSLPSRPLSFRVMPKTGAEMNGRSTSWLPPVRRRRGVREIRHGLPSPRKPSCRASTCRPPGQRSGPAGSQDQVWSPWRSSAYPSPSSAMASWPWSTAVLPRRAVPGPSRTSSPRCPGTPLRRFALPSPSHPHPP